MQGLTASGGIKALREAVAKNRGHLGYLGKCVAMAEETAEARALLMATPLLSDVTLRALGLEDLRPLLRVARRRFPERRHHADGVYVSASTVTIKEHARRS